MSSNQELLAAVRTWATANYPGCPLERITIHLRFLPVAIELPDVPSLAAVQPAPASATATTPAAAATSPDERGPSLSPVVMAILNTLREVGRPLSRTRLLEEMARRGHDWSERTVARYLTNLIEDGTLENPPDVRPRGYRLLAEAEAEAEEAEDETPTPRGQRAPRGV